ncbi:MAG TPA: bifunctional 4-hydroxy-2-oxoglutarate aldolase/2-dehydro-3-deoxy-phosphogluconate aldolase [Patescibacteria group bacterium]|nr:bifunctional 4-hydroxy-2-oxoglutarate aldolase/2-dehydro-3-deoxy-phosphogluconate aldolase [Patescibacteria group bacterium]
MNAIRDSGVIAVIRATSSRELVKVAEAMAAGGIKAIEVSMTTPDAIDVLLRAKESGFQGVAFGAGTVIDVPMALRVLDAGADFVLSPAFDPDVIATCAQRGIPAIPGCLTPTEIVAARTAGAQLIKIFPASVGGPQLIRDILSPLPDLELIAVGGVDQRNAAEYIRAGACAVGVGSSLFHEGPEGFDYRAITQAARDLLAAVRRVRQSATPAITDDQ